jgi:vitamin B12/bleomycin/antimicrobial peptide transport system ATP-binding/permease protein
MTANAAPTPKPVPTTIRGKWRAFAQFARRAWALSHPFFNSDDRWRARALLAAIIALNLGAVYMLVLINEWNRVFYDALQNKDEAVFWKELWTFLWLAFGYIVIAVYRFYITQLLELRWRRWMTNHYTARWLANHAFYRLELTRYQSGEDAHADNPDQRIHEDINLFSSYTVGLSMGLLNAAVTLVSFVGILWSLSGDFAFAWQGADYAIPGFMVWMAVIYALAGSVISHWIGRPLIALNYEQQRREADYRHMLVRTREYSDAVALDRGEAWQQQGLGQRFGAVLGNYLTLIRAQKRLTWFTVGFSQLAVVFPFIVAAPRFFSGAIQLGQLMQIASAFGRVQDALSWFVDNYAGLASWRATTDRLTRFDDAMAYADATPNGTPDTPPSPGATAWHAHGLVLALPDGRPIGAPLDLNIAAGERLWIQGPSGCGKSTLLRTLAGVWPWSQGALTRPADALHNALFLPQRAYFPNGSLRQALAYPEAPDTFDDATLERALDLSMLPELKTRLDEQAAWGQLLSGGEQQRLALARVFLKQPRWLFLDEATSALDETTEATLYQRLVDWAEGAGSAIISVAHRPQVAPFHTRRLVMSTPNDSLIINTNEFN